MGKSSSVISQVNIPSPNLELPSTVSIKKSSISHEKLNRDISKTKKTDYLKIFKNLIVVTSIIFSFGGLGFGLTLRYATNLDISQSNNLPINNSNSYD